MSSENRSSNNRLLRLRSPIVLIRLSSLLVFLLMAGHMSAYPWTSSQSPQQSQLADSMKAVDFVFFGEHATYWSLYYGWGLLVGVLLLALAVMLWLLSDLSPLAPRRVGVIAGVISATCLAGAYLSIRYFYLPPTVFFMAICAILSATAVLLLRQRPENT